MTNLMTEIVLECAVDAISQGLTAAHLTTGWNLGQGDVEAIEDAMERKLTADEWAFAKETFAAFVRANS